MTNSTTNQPWPTHNIELEQALLGAIFLNNDAFPIAERHVEEACFYEPLHQQIWALCSQLIGAGKRADPTILRSFMPNVMVFENISVSKYLAMLAANATPIVNTPDYAKTIRELADRRRLSEIGMAMQPADASSSVNLATEAIGELDKILAARSDNGQPTIVTMRQAQQRALDATAEAYRNGSKIIGVPTGLRDLDAKLLGLARGDLVVLAGRPGMGKSAVICSMLRMQAEAGFRAEFSSLEMSDIQLAQRMQADVMFDHDGDRIPYSVLRNGNFHERVFDRVVLAARRLEVLNIPIDARPKLTVAQIGARARQIKRKEGLDVLAIDHLDLIQATGRYAGMRVYELGEITSSLKALAKELDIVVILLSQLSREVEKREDKRPILSDLRSSGSIEQDADTVIFLYRPAYYLANMDPTPGTPEYLKWETDSAAAHNKLLAIVAKQRSGPTGTVELFCDIGCNAVRSLGYDGRHEPQR